MRLSLSLSMIFRREGAISQELTSTLEALCDTEQVYVVLQRVVGTSRQVTSMSLPGCRFLAVITGIPSFV